MLNHFSQLVLALHRGCREQPVSEFQHWALEQVKSALHFDSALWLTGSLSINAQAAIHSVHAHDLSPQILADWACVPQSRAVLTERVFGSPGTTFNCVTADEFGPALLEHSRRYNIEHILATTSIDGISKLHEMISVYRAAPDNPFSEEERQFQQNLIPHLAETWRINRLHHMNLAQQPSCRTTSCSAVIDNKGVLHLIDPGFTHLLLGEWPDWQGPTLPPELVRTAQRDEAIFSGNSFITRAHKMGDFLLLRGRKKALLDNLSKREHEVARHYASGMSHKEIAQHLNIAAGTVRNQLNMVYAKLKINDKGALAAYLSQF
jgi:DNA-binding CsgD family transcriptional regulator